MQNLPKVVKSRKKRVGRGYGSGKGGHTVGRGQKGQKSRRSLHILFEGFKVKKSLLRRLPVQRGKDKFKSISADPIILNLDQLNKLKDGAVVDIPSLAKAGIVNEGKAILNGVKILSDGKLDKKLKVKLPASKTASKKILEAGGTIE